MKRVALNWLRVLRGVQVALCVILAEPLACAAGPWISEILFNPPGSVDAPNEYLEIRGTPNSTVPAGTYLISVEGNTNGNPRRSFA